MKFKLKLIINQQQNVQEDPCTNAHTQVVDARIRNLRLRLVRMHLCAYLHVNIVMSLNLEFCIGRSFC